jgi:hypothetical protein
MTKRIKYKKCKCPKDYWEVIIYDHDEDYDDKSTIHYHCDFCGTDWYVMDFYTKKILYRHGKYSNSFV